MYDFLCLIIFAKALRRVLSERKTPSDTVRLDIERRFAGKKEYAFPPWKVCVVTIVTMCIRKCEHAYSRS